MVRANNFKAFVALAALAAAAFVLVLSPRAAEAVPVQPQITSVSPTSASLGSPVDMTINGSGFISSAYVGLFKDLGDGNFIIETGQITSLTSTKITATFPLVSDVPPGKYDVTVDQACCGEDYRYTRLSQAFELVADNASPTVNAGADRTVASTATSVQLNGLVSDDGFPNPPGEVTTLWSQVSGPTATINSPSSLSSSVTLPKSGEYVFKLTADDSEAKTSDEVTVRRADNYMIELKSWIPHSKVVDPVHPKAHPGPTVDSCFSGKYDFDPRSTQTSTFRGDKHRGFNGTYRADIFVNFDWDGTDITNVQWIEGGSVGTTWRDWTFKKKKWDRARKCSQSGEGSAGGRVYDDMGEDQVWLALEQADPLIIGAPPLDALLIAKFDTPSNLNLQMHSDAFPNYGYRIAKNGDLLFTHVARETSCWPVLGLRGATYLTIGLNVPGDTVNQSVATNSTSPRSIIAPCSAEQPE